jgi:predicted transcriptional regulator
MARKCASEANKGHRGIRGVPTWFTSSTDMETFKSTIQGLVEDGLSDSKIAKIFDISGTAVYNWRKKLDIGNRRPNLRNPTWLYQQYIIHNMSAQDIADMLGCTSAAVQQYLVTFNISVRSASDRQKLANIKRANTISIKRQVST